MRRRLLPYLALACALLLPAAPAQALDGAALKSTLGKLHRPLGGWAGAHVVDLDTGRTLYSRRPDLGLAPASNEKLFVTSAALLRFGPEGTLDTTLRAAPTAVVDEDGVLRGDLYLVGAGDPTLGDDGLRDLAAGLAEAGVYRVDGAILGDESLFDRLRGGPDSAWRPDWDLGGWLSALSWRHGRAGSGGPAATAARRLGALLKSDGVRYARRPRAGRMARGAAASAVTLATVSSPSMRRLAAMTNLPSENFYAEMLLKALGARFGAGGTTSAGVAAVRDALGPFGVRPRMADGSGLSRADRTSARQVVRLLDRMDQEEALASAWRASLPVAGRSGTLSKRMRRTAAAGRCRAKTGTLIGVSALSGYCTTTTGANVAFSFIENRVCNWCAKKVEDRMVAAIARYDGLP